MVFNGRKRAGVQGCRERARRRDFGNGPVAGPGVNDTTGRSGQGVWRETAMVAPILR